MVSGHRFCLRSEVRRSTAVDIVPAWAAATAAVFVPTVKKR